MEHSQRKRPAACVHRPAAGLTSLEGFIEALKLNYPEAMAFINKADFIERRRDGKTVAELMRILRQNGIKRFDSKYIMTGRCG